MLKIQFVTSVSRAGSVTSSSRPPSRMLHPNTAFAAWSRLAVEFGDIARMANLRVRRNLGSQDMLPTAEADLMPMPSIL